MYESNNICQSCGNNEWMGKEIPLEVDHIDGNKWNFRQALIEVGLTPKGGNYKRCHQIKREYDDNGALTTIGNGGEGYYETI